MCCEKKLQRGKTSAYFKAQNDLGGFILYISTRYICAAHQTNTLGGHGRNKIAKDIQEGLVRKSQTDVPLAWNFRN